MEDTLSTKNIFYDETDLTLLYFHVTNALKSGLSRSKKKIASTIALKNEKYCISSEKLFFLSQYLNFCLDFLVM